MLLPLRYSLLHLRFLLAGFPRVVFVQEAGDARDEILGVFNVADILPFGSTKKR